jgi:hypothetical protein
MRRDSQRWIAVGQDQVDGTAGNCADFAGGLLGEVHRRPRLPAPVL